MKAPVVCPLTKYGCSCKIRRCDFGSHLKTVPHQESLLNFLEKLKELINAVNPKAKTLTTMSTTVKQNNIDHSESMETEHDSALYSVAHINDLHVELAKCYELLTTLTQAVETLSLDMNRLSAQSLYSTSLIPRIYDQLNELKKHMTEKDSHTVTISAKQESCQQDVSHIAQKLEEIRCASFDGSLVWRVINIADKMGDAKMLMKGDYDSILKWPFNHKVTFCLFDQSGQNHHVIHSFCPDTKSTSFQRPCSEMNIASGIPKFISLPMIQEAHNNYIDDDTMFIKVSVDFVDLPKIVLRHVLSLNPGLPFHVQQSLIKDEIKKCQDGANTDASDATFTLSIGTCE
ncbi:unnamed protein product [Didymodactylos carnosus]|uniref:TRAF1-6 MATH domain-containing protein n=1 Tax=Didymodactylos carnosus TaxID=1234261 RepID=A0A815KN03_9BILA|nr:unnamed protein product [Didymodactylos carnosus]CAF4292524.1 unnamed protein product [Didymodactylos carnosus]